MSKSSPRRNPATQQVWDNFLLLKRQRLHSHKNTPGCVKCIINSLALNCCTQTAESRDHKCSPTGCVHFSLPATVRTARPRSSTSPPKPTHLPSPHHPPRRASAYCQTFVLPQTLLYAAGLEETSSQAKCLLPQMDASRVIRVCARDRDDFVRRLPLTLNRSHCCWGASLCLWSRTGIITMQCSIPKKSE